MKCLDRFPIPKLLKFSKSLISDKESVKAFHNNVYHVYQPVYKSHPPSTPQVHSTWGKREINNVYNFAKKKRQRKTREKEKIELNITK